MQKRAFINRIRSLFSIDGYLLPELTSHQQSQFLRDPLRYFLDSDEAQSDAIMREVEARQKDDVSAAFAAVSVEKPEAPRTPKTKKAKRRVEGQREMLLPIAGGKPVDNGTAKIPEPGRKVG